MCVCVYMCVREREQKKKKKNPAISPVRATRQPHESDHFSQRVTREIHHDHPSLTSLHSPCYTATALCPNDLPWIFIAWHYLRQHIRGHKSIKWDFFFPFFEKQKKKKNNKQTHTPTHTYSTTNQIAHTYTYIYMHTKSIPDKHSAWHLHLSSPYTH
jgi:hypothetical protein